MNDTRPSFDSVTSKIAGALPERQLNRFRRDFSLNDPLAFFHEIVHWYQRKTLLSWSLNRLLISAHHEVDEKKKRHLYEKYVAARQMLMPYGEGLSLFAEFDYYPANFAMPAGDHNDFDELFELVVSNRYSFQSYERQPVSEVNIHADRFIRAFRLTPEGLAKRERLMMMPLGSGHPHIAGYLFIKRAISAIKRQGVSSYIHDGAIVSGLTWYIFEAPELCELVNDDNCLSDDFIQAFKAALAVRLNNLWTGPTAGKCIARFGKLGGSRGAMHALLDMERYWDANRKHSLQANELLQVFFRESVEEYMDMNETIEEYDDDDEDDPQALWAVDGYSVLMAMDAARFGVFEAVLTKSDEDWVLRFGESGFELALKTLGQPSIRAERYQWLIEKTPGMECRLVEALFFFDKKLFHTTIIDSSQGMLHLSHKTNDYNVGYFPVKCYLEDSFRIDSILENMNRELQTYETCFPQSREQSATHVEDLYGGPAREICDNFLPPGSGIKRISDIFPNREERLHFAALSLILPMHAYADESFRTFSFKVDRYLHHFQLDSLKPSKVKSYLRKGDPFFYTDMRGRRRISYKSGTLI